MFLSLSHRKQTFCKLHRSLTYQIALEPMVFKVGSSAWPSINLRRIASPDFMLEFRTLSTCMKDKCTLSEYAFHFSEKLCPNVPYNFTFECDTREPFRGCSKTSRMQKKLFLEFACLLPCSSNPLQFIHLA